MDSQRVPLAIVGIGCLFPKADGPGAFWSNIKHGVDCVGPVPETHWRPDDYFDSDPGAPDMTYAARGAFLEPVEFNPLEFGISPVDLEAIDTSQLLGLVAARQALNDAGYNPNRKFDKNRISVILGVTGTLELVIPLGARLGHPKWRKALAAAGVAKATADKVVQDISDSYVPWQENSFPGLLGNVVAGRIANKLDLGGTNCVVDAACASSLSAIHLAGLELAAGRCDVAVTGGVDTFNDIFMYMCFSKTPALSKSGDAKPFDADGDGTILGEGLGIVVLKRLADAERDGDRIYAVLKAIGSSSDGKGNAVYAPSADGQVRALKNAYEQADVSPATIELVEAHGTGTKVGDTVEATALAEVFRQASPDGGWCALGSIKSMIGHTKAAAGAAGLIKAALALYNKVLPPTIKVKQPVVPLAPGKSPLYVNTQMRPWLSRPGHPRRAGLSAFGFGGSNFHAVLEEHRSDKIAPDWDGRVQIVAFSGDSCRWLAERLATWPANLAWAEMCTRAAESRASFDHRAHVRLLIVAQRNADHAKLFAAAKAKVEAEPAAASWALADGAYFGQGPATGKLGLLFPGQGSQTVGMLRDLACTFPEMITALSEAESGWNGSRRLVDYVYPHPAFAADTRAEQELALRATDIAQPALGAINIGAWAILQRFGIRADAFAGHSYGELVALCAAGAFDSAALHQISRERGRLMASFRGDDAGAMLAVHAPVADVEAVIRDDELNLAIANRNSPVQCVLSGPTAEIARAEATLQRRRLRHSRLPVAAAFHSQLVARASAPFREALEEVAFHRTRTPVFANSNAAPYPDNSHDAQELLAEQLARPVQFARQVENMALAGIRTFLEVGPGSVLTRLADATVKARPELTDCDCAALDASGGKKPGLADLAHALARLAARGHAIDLARWEAGQTYPVRLSKPGLTVPIVGANYVRPKPPGERPSPHPEPASTKPIDPSSRPARVVTDPPRTLMTEPPNPPTPNSPTSPALASALGVTQQSLLAFQRLHEETARLHKQFLDNQQASLATLQALIAQQQSLLTGQSLAPVTFAAAPSVAASSPAPVYVPPPPMVQPLPPVAAPGPAPAPVKPPASIPIAPPNPVVARDSSAALLAVVAEKTGYPADMLGLDMALDADLGIDSIKRVEILSALQEKIPDAPAVKPEHLGTLHTLRDIVNFLGAVGPTPQVNGSLHEPITAPRVAESTSATNGRDVAGTLLAVVAEKTGYPADMLGLDMALDADLGIDSIKRVEILSALQEKIPDAPAVKPEHLGTLHTLRDIACFLSDAAGGVGAAVTPPAETPRPFEAGLTPGPAESERAADLFSSNIVRSIVRPVPIELEVARPRVALARNARVWLIAEPSGIVSRLAQQLEAAGCRTQTISWSESPAAHDPVGLSGLVLLAPDQVPDDLPLRAFRWLKRAAPALVESGQAGGAFFATVSTLDGAFGFGKLALERSPAQGALAGLSKTAAQEWPRVSCKAIDADPDVLDHIPHILAEEILTIGPVEVGVSAKGRIALALSSATASPDVNATPAWKDGDVIVVTGGARGVTAEALFPLVRSSPPQLVLLGRTPIPAGEPQWLASEVDDAKIKHAIIAHSARGMTPREVGEECKRILALREVRRNISRLREAGATVEYLPVDVQDGPALTAALADVQRRLGPVSGIIHGAGVLADRKIEELTEDQFQYVYSTKVTGFQNVLAATKDNPLKAIILFSSSTARFGRVGQAAYAAANEVLNKSAQQLARARPQCRTVAFNWGPWDGGMVTPALARIFENEGIGLISHADGGETLVRELVSADRPVEVVVLARPPKPAEEPAAQKVTSLGVAPVFERKVSLDDHPILRSHMIGDKAVLPFVLHLEWMAHAAMHGNPGLKFHGFDELRIFQGVHVEEAAPTPLRVLSGRAVKRDGLFVVPAEIRGTRKGREVTHSRGEIVLAERLPDAAASTDLPVAEPTGLVADELYEEILFHGPDLRAIERLESMDDAGALAFVRTAPSPSAWNANPVRAAWLADPLALDAAFQLLSVWSYQIHQAVSLPCFAKSYRQYRRAFPADGVFVSVRIRHDAGTTVRADIEFTDAEGRLVAKIFDAEHVIDASLNEAFRRGRLAGQATIGS